MVVRRTH